MKSRKRKRNVKNWKINVRKINYQKGVQHFNSKGILSNARKIKKSCDQKCFRKCNLRITNKEREILFKSFYNIDLKGKRDLINRSVEKSLISKNSSNSVKRYNYNYHFFVGNHKIGVCKQYFLSTLDISQTFVYSVLNSRDLVSGVISSPKRGKHKKKVISLERKTIIRNHINSFPCVTSHYRRSESSKMYLESSLNIPKMYYLYEEMCTKN